MKSKILKIFLFFVIGLSLVSCGETDTTTLQADTQQTTTQVTTNDSNTTISTQRELNDLEERLYDIYELVFYTGSFSGTFDEWLVDVSAPTDNTLDVSFMIKDNYLNWRYSNGAWNQLVELSSLTNINGTYQRLYINQSNELIIEYTNDTVNLGVISILLEISFYDMSNALIESIYISKGDILQAPSAPTIEGYSFTGWSTDLSSINGNLSVTAQYSLNEYTISFNPNGGTSVTEVTLAFGSSITGLDNSSKEGYIFAGWYTNEALTEPFDDAVMPSNDFTLYADWTINQYTIDFQTNGGTDVASIVQDYSTDVLEPFEPTKLGYSFVGWYEDIDLINAYSFTTMPAQDITLYAGWSPTENTVNFVLNDGTAQIEVVTDYTGEALLEPVREGYTFEGWFKDQELLQAYTLETFPPEDTTLYAFWTLNKYRVDYVIPSLGDSPEATILLGVNETITEYALGTGHSMILTSEGRIFVSGYNYQGILGNNTEVDSLNYIDITAFFNLNSNEKIIEIYAGYWHSLAITSAGRVFTWGVNDHGQLGLGHSNVVLTPQDITGQIPLHQSETITKVSLGSETSGILTSEGRMFFFGLEYNITESNTILTPIEYHDHFNLLSNELIEDIFIGDNSYAIKTSNGRIFTWGSNNHGQLGNGNLITTLEPQDITANFHLEVNEEIVFIETITRHSIARTSFGRVFTWGQNGTGCLGNGTEDDSSLPIDITGLFHLNSNETIVSVSYGTWYGAALSSEGRVFTFGSYNYGVLGDGNYLATMNSFVPTDITSMFNLNETEEIVFLVNNGNLNMVRTSLDRIFYWGYNFYGQMGNGESEVIEGIPTLYSINEAVVQHSTEYDYQETIDSYIPTIDGYTFGGWFLDSNYITPFEMTSMPAYDLILYGKATPITYQITYTLTEGTSGNNPLTYNIQTENIILEEPTREGYTFAWYDNPGFLGNPVTRINQGSTGDINLYGKWTLIEYTITYQLNGGDNHLSNPLTYTVESSTFSLINPTRAGYDFNYWKSDGQLITEIPSASTGDMVITAYWSSIAYTIEYVLNDGIQDTNNRTGYLTGQSTFSILDPTRENYVFEGWYETSDFSGEIVSEITQGTYGNIILYARWVAPLQDIHYTLYGGTNSPSNPEAYTIESPTITLSNPTRDGYHFLGWYDNTSFNGEPITQIVLGSTGDVYLYAKWEVITYTISYETMGGTTPLTVSYTIEDVNIFIGASERSGYWFSGWYDNPELVGTSISAIPNGSFGDVTLYANWDLRTYSIQYDLDGATENDNPSSYTIKDTALTLNVPVKEGYTFEGFYTNSSFTSAELTEIPYGATGNYYLYAKFTLTEYDITYHLDSGTNDSSNPDSYTMNSALISFEDPTKTGYQFVGWFYNSEFTGEEADYIYAGSTGDVTIYAKFTAIEYTVDYLIMDDTYVSGDIVLLPYETIVQVEVSTSHSAALTSKGRMLTWGRNNFGQLGDNTTTDKLTPVDITDYFNLVSGETITYINLGPYNSAAITSNGRVFTWGYYSSTYNVLGTMSVSSNQLVPYDITSEFNLSNEETITKILLGNKHGSALSSDGNYFIWGRRSYDLVSYRYTPGGNMNSLLNLNSGEYVVDIALSNLNSAIITSEGRLLVWGDNNYGQLGNGQSMGGVNSPLDITSYLTLTTGETVEEVTIGDYYMGIYTSNNRVLTWGDNTYGQLGNNTTVESSSPLDISSQFTLDSGDSISQIYFEGNSSSMLTTNGKIYIWGQNTEGNIGDSSTTNRHIPTEISANFSLDAEDYIISSSIAVYNSAAVSHRGNIFLWGDNTYGQLGDDTLVDKTSPNEITFYQADLDSHVIHYYQDVLNYVPTLSGYTFDGWYTDPECTQTFTLSNMPEENLVLYGQWIEN